MNNVLSTSKKIIGISLGLVLISQLNGCIFRDRSNDYLKSGSLKPMTLPADVKSVPMEPLYPIPEANRSDTDFYALSDEEFTVPRPESMNIEAEKAKIKIQRVGEHKWILAEAPAGQIWPLAQNYLASVGIGVAKSLPSTGLVETESVVFKSDDSTQNRYQMRIEQGLRPDTTEIHVLHQQTPIRTAFTEWPATSNSAERETKLMDDLANALALGVGNNAVSLLGQKVGGDIKAKLVLNSGEPVLQLRLDKARATASLMHALKRDGYTLWEQNNTHSIFYTQFHDTAKKRNWFIRLFTFEPTSTIKTAPYSIHEILTHLADEPPVKSLFSNQEPNAYNTELNESFGFLVVLTETPSLIQVNVRDTRGRPLNALNAKRMLEVLRRNLI